MYHYTEFDRQFVKLRAAQHRDQLERWQKGQLTDEEFRPLRLQNGWYVQRYAPMLRVAVPYGEISAKQLSVLATIAKDYDQPEVELFAKAQVQQDLLPGKSPKLIKGYGHFTTRQNVQFNWIPLSKSADVMDLLATVDMHGIQTSGNCIRNITTDELAGVAVDEVVDPRPYAEILRQWSTLHPEFAFLPRKFKIAITGATEDRAAIGWHDVGLQLVKNVAGEVGFKVWVGGGMGRTPIIGTLVREFLPWQQIMNYLEAVVRVYNRWGRRDNLYKARIKILVKAEGQRYIDEVEAEFDDVVNKDGGPHTISQAEFERVAACFVEPSETANSSHLHLHRHLLRHLHTATPKTQLFNAGCIKTLLRTKIQSCVQSLCLSNVWDWHPVMPQLSNCRPLRNWSQSTLGARLASLTPKTWCCLGFLKLNCLTFGRKPNHWAWQVPTLVY
jgi:sulfite reductase (NADPH) hemoprotein beta-component